MSSGVQRRGVDAVKTLSRIWISSAQALLSTDVVHGSSGSYVHCHHNNGYSRPVREK